MNEKMFRCGFVVILGRPNVGKSTLLNTIIGEKVAAVTAKPQTTRNRITGIYHGDSAQIIFVDTPGIHQAGSLLNRSLVSNALNAVQSVDAAMVLFDGTLTVNDDDLAILDSLRPMKHLPKIAVINKIDKVKKPLLLPLMQKLEALSLFSEIIPISATKNDGISLLLERIECLLPVGDALFPQDYFTDKTERFIAQEIIREQLILKTREEIPYISAIIIDSFKEDTAKKLLVIKATINLEKESQKAIVIGKSGDMLKRIGTASRQELEKIFGTKVFLELFVRVQKNWTKNPKLLREFGIVE
ncbi:MAG: GTPase Era [Deltaproteobacteria bacterium]|nr:GTPase Era [Deltaproteobacteria bacterium]